MGNRPLLNILLMSISFLLIFTAFNSSSLILQRITDGMKIDKKLNVHWDGFRSLGIIYGVFAFSSFLVPSVLSVVSSARCLFLASLTYFAYTVIFLKPMNYVLEIFSAILGFGAAVIWTAQGNYLTENSDSKTIDRNTGIFWSIFQGSLIFGNLYVYFTLKSSNATSSERYISSESRETIFKTLSVICGVGCFLLLFLKNTISRTITKDRNSSLDQTSPLIAFNKCLRLLKTKKMLFLSLACFYSGLELAFYGGVFSTVIGNTNFTHSITPNTNSYQYSDQLIGIYGCLVGAGSIIGGLLFGLSGKRFVQNNRSRVFLLGFIIHMISYFLIFANHSNSSPNRPTEDFEDGYIIKRSLPSISLLCGFMMGFGDACYNTQIISLIGTIYTDDSNYTSSAFALYKFTQSIGAAISFLYSYLGSTYFPGVITLYFHLISLVIFSVLGSYSFVLVENLVIQEDF